MKAWFAIFTCLTTMCYKPVEVLNRPHKTQEECYDFAELYAETMKIEAKDAILKCEEREYTPPGPFVKRPAK